MSQGGRNTFHVHDQSDTVSWHSVQTPLLQPHPLYSINYAITVVSQTRFSLISFAGQTLTPRESLAREAK